MKLAHMRSSVELLRAPIPSSSSSVAGHGLLGGGEDGRDGLVEAEPAAQQRRRGGKLAGMDGVVAGAAEAHGREATIDVYRPSLMLGALPVGDRCA